MRCFKTFIVFLSALVMIGIFEKAFCTAYAETSHILNNSASGTWAYIDSIEEYEAWVSNQEPSALLLTRSEIESFGEFAQFSYFYIFDDGYATHWKYEVLTEDDFPLTVNIFPSSSEELYIINRQVQSVSLEDWYAADGMDGFPQGEYSISGIYYADGYNNRCYQVGWYVDNAFFQIAFYDRADGNSCQIADRFIDPETAGQTIDDFMEMIGLPAESFAEKTKCPCNPWDTVLYILGGTGAPVLVFWAVHHQIQKRNSRIKVQQLKADGESVSPD